MRGVWRTAAISAAAAWCLATAGHASTYTADYLGDTNGFSDPAGIFGGVSDQFGDTPIGWTAEFVYTDAGIGISASFKMNGVTINIGGSGNAATNSFYEFSNSQSDGTTSLFLGFGYAFETPAPADPTGTYGPFLNLCSGSFSTAGGTGGDLCPITLTISAGSSPPAGIPEPVTWTLMMVGFGVAGAALRRRRTGHALRAKKA